MAIMGGDWVPTTLPTRRISDGLAVMPGTALSCLLITVSTVLLTVFAGHQTVDMLLRPLYFLLLFATFRAIRRRDAELHTLPLRLVEAGFLILAMGYIGSAALRLTEVGDPHALAQMERGAVFLLGVTLIAYGIVLFVPYVLDSQARLRQHGVEIQNRLEAVATSHDHMEHRVVEADRYRALGELAAGVAHDLRNPLGIVRAATDSLRRRYRDPEDFDEHVKVIQRNLDKAERTIKGLLDLGRSRDVNLEPTSLRDVVTEVLALVAVEARNRRVLIDVAAPALVEVVTDGRHLLQALLNLILNALHAAPRDTIINVGIRRLRGRNQDMAAITIADRGSGLPADVRQKLFTPFFTTKDTGTGLGLLSCKRILEDLGGGVRLFSRHGGGTRAIVILPLAATATTCSC